MPLQIEKDYKRNIGLIKTLHKYFIRNSNISQSLNKYYNIMFKYILNGFTTFGQDWSLSIIIAFIISEQKEQSIYFYFNQLYPYYSFFASNIFYTTINPINYIKNKYHDLFGELYLQPITDPSAPFVLKILQGEFINKELTNEEIDKLKIILFYSNYFNDEVRYYYKIYGLIFMLFAYCLPDLYFCDAVIRDEISNDIFNINNKGNQNNEEWKFKLGTSKKVIYNFFMKKSIDEIHQNYKRIINEYLPDYYKYAKSHPIYDSNDFNRGLEIKLSYKYLEPQKEIELLTPIKEMISYPDEITPIPKDFKNQSLGLNSIEIIPKVNSKIKEILFTPITY